MCIFTFRQWRLRALCKVFLFFGGQFWELLLIDWLSSDVPNSDPLPEYYPSRCYLIGPLIHDPIDTFAFSCCLFDQLILLLAAWLIPNKSLWSWIKIALPHSHYCRDLQAPVWPIPHQCFKKYEDKNVVYYITHALHILQKAKPETNLIAKGNAECCLEAYLASSKIKV